MPIYANINGSQRETTEWYANIGGSSRSLSAMYANIGGSQKKIFEKIKTLSELAVGDLFYLSENGRDTLYRLLLKTSSSEYLIIRESPYSSTVEIRQNNSPTYNSMNSVASTAYSDLDSLIKPYIINKSILVYAWNNNSYVLSSSTTNAYSYVPSAAELGGTGSNSSNYYYNNDSRRGVMGSEYFYRDWDSYGNYLRITYVNQGGAFSYNQSNSTQYIRPVMNINPNITIKTP